MRLRLHPAESSTTTVVPIGMAWRNSQVSGRALEQEGQGVQELHPWFEQLIIFYLLYVLIFIRASHYKVGFIGSTLDKTIKTFSVPEPPHIEELLGDSIVVFLWNHLPDCPHLLAAISYH